MVFIRPALMAAALMLATQPPARSPDVFRVAVDLVQVDATVSDERGRQVTDLAADDFELLQDGRPQTITSFTFVPVDARRGGASLAPPLGSGDSSPAPPARTIAVVVDDLGLSFDSVARVRSALERFVQSQVRPDDRIAIVRTGGGVGALQQFTSDRRTLQAAIDRVRWNTRGRISRFANLGDVPDGPEQLEDEIFSAGTLGAARAVVRGMADVPGRKALILLTDGFRITDGDRKFGRVLVALHALIDAANRAGVLVYTIDARGLVAPATARRADAAPVADQQAETRNMHDALGLLAEQTGGLFIRNANDVSAGLERVLDDQHGYYLLGYVPDRATFNAERPRFHRLQLRVKRRGLRVRSRAGFLGVPGEHPGARLPADRMLAAVMSPFAGGTIRLRLSSFFGHVEALGPAVHHVMHVNAGDLTFVQQEDGLHHANIETLAVSFGEAGELVDQHSWRYTLKLTPEAYARASTRGFVYRLRVPVKRPGPYQLRIALRDVASDRIGSASQFVDVPDVDRGRLTLSGLVIEGVADRTASAVAGAEAAVEDVDPNSTAALRTFRRGSNASYVCYVYNARRDRDGKPRLETEIRLLRGREEVVRGAAGPAVTAPGTQQIVAGGVLHLGPVLPPGSYILELTVIDRLAKRSARATQTIDFDVVDNP